MTTRASVDVETGIWRAGSGAPSSGLGGAGDFYVDTGTGTSYYKASSAYAVLSTAVWGYKNAVMNGLFEAWQRGTSFTSLASATYTADRWFYSKTSTAVHDVSRSTDVPTVAQAGLLVPYSFLVDCTTADAATAAGDLVYIGQRLEGYICRNFAQRALTLSFWVKATKTGTYCVGFMNSNGDRTLTVEYTVSVTNTWERKTLSVPASPSAGTWDYISGIGLQICWILQAGSTYQITAGAWQSAVASGLATSNQVNACDSTSNDFRLALVQLEAGSAATDFAPVPFEVELARCQRYFWKTFDYATAPAQSAGVTGAASFSQIVAASTAQGGMTLIFPTRMRTAPTVTGYNFGAANNQARNATTNTDCTSTTPAAYEGGMRVSFTTPSGSAAGQGIHLHLTADAEL